MIKKEKTLWSQLNGPQITAFSNAMWEYAIEKYDDRLDYFDRLTIENANSYHLDFIGRLMKIPRAIIITEKFYNDLIYFSTQREVDIMDTFSGVIDGVWKDGGMFDYNGVINNDNYKTIDDDTYRAILIEMAKTEGNVKGLTLIDTLCDTFLWSKNNKKLRYEIKESPDSVGDIFVGTYGFSGYSQIVLQQVMNSLFNGMPKVIISIKE